MNVIYESARATVICGDATDPALIDAAPTSDLLCTDPPYGVRWQSNTRREKYPELAGDDGTLDVPAVLGAWTRRLRVNRHVYVFGYSPDQLKDPLRLGGTTDLVWDKTALGPGNLALPWGPSHERITFGVYCPSPKARENGTGRLAARLRRQSVLTARRRSGMNSLHPTEKPIGLMAELIESSSLRGDLVLDPFAGGGSTLVAAILTGRRAYGIELEPRYAEVTAERVRQAEAVADIIADAMGDAQ